MKIDRVILAVNNNPVYTQHWNIVSPIWEKKFKIKPTLVFYGDEYEFKSLNFDTSKYDFIILPKLNEFSEQNPDWVVTWALFYAASKFKNEICMLSGIDQIPLSSLFFEKIKDIDNDKFIIGFSDAYKTYDKNTLGYFNTKTNVLYPSSHLVGSGNNFKEIFDIDDEWYNEVKKVFTSKDRYYLNNKFYSSKMWGIDECYSSEKLSLYKDEKKIEKLDFFWEFFYPRRIDIDGRINFDFNKDLLIDGYYSEVTCKNIHNGKLLEILNMVENIKLN